MTVLNIYLQKKEFNVTINLPASKSESNRAVILNALSKNTSKLYNISDSHDTVLMQQLVTEKSELINAEDAGTVMRFLTAYYAFSGTEKTLTGTERMCERPIGPLVNALNELGADIHYKNKEGYPPIQIKKTSLNNQKTNKISIDSSISSQYITALLLIAPSLPQGLHLTLTGNISSAPYIALTLGTLSSFGVVYTKTENTIHIAHQQLVPTSFTVENDWSAVGYWCSIVALSQKGKIALSGLKKNSLQGDKEILNIYTQFGVQHRWENDLLLIEKDENFIATSTQIHLDFSDIPDQALTVCVTASALGIPLEITGVESLKIKETNRVHSLAVELQKCGGDVIEKPAGIYEVKPISNIPENTTFETYNDHRMAMSFAALAMLKPISILNPECVRKSYPTFWEEIKK